MQSESGLSLEGHKILPLIFHLEPLRWPPVESGLPAMLQSKPVPGPRYLNDQVLEAIACERRCQKLWKSLVLVGHN